MAKITKFDKDTLTEVVSQEVDMPVPTGMTISHYADSVKSTEATIPFTIQGVERHVPEIEDVEFCIVVRKKIDLTAIGKNENAIKNNGNDVGSEDYSDSSPSRPLDLPPGFRELYRNR
jgi:hypothetical protein